MKPLFYCIFLLNLGWTINPSDVKADPKPITVGVIIPLTGEWASWGQRIRQGLELFSSEHLTPYLWQFHFEVEGSCEAKKAVTAYQTIRSRDKASMYVLGCMNGARAIAPLAKTDGSLLLSAGFEQREVFALGARLVNLALQVDSEANALAKFISTRGTKKLAVLRNQGVEDFVSGMKETLGNKVQITSDSVLSTDELNFSSVILQLKSGGSDGVFMNLGEFQLAAALKSFRQLHWDKPIYTSYGTDTLLRSNPDLLKLAEGIYYSHPQASVQSDDLKTRFTKVFKVDPSIYSLFVYDGMSLLEDAVSKCDVVSNTGYF